MSEIQHPYSEQFRRIAMELSTIDSFASLVLQDQVFTYVLRRFEQENRTITVNSDDIKELRPTVDNVIELFIWAN